MPAQRSAARRSTPRRGLRSRRPSGNKAALPRRLPPARQRLPVSRDEWLFKWIKQHLRIKAFFGASENAVKIQIWIAVSVYVLVAIIRKQLGVEPLPNLGQAETEIADQ